VKAVFHPDFYQVYTTDPAAEAGRMESVVEVIRSRMEVIAPEPASLEDIGAVHTVEHVAQVKAQGLHAIASLAAGGAILTARTGLEEPCFGLIRPPGHHASAGSAWGFCYYNNMAIAVDHLKRKGLVKRVFILDFDLHFGDGTVNILGRRDWVTILNPDGADRNAYLKTVLNALDETDADMIAISAGFDNHMQDWGGLLATDDYLAMGRAVRKTAERNNGGCFALLEGGYNHRVLGLNVLALTDGLSEAG
jgi:acetoin utilization deacetylase AcuC-like enzyme